jgi:DNA-binding NarL/FixJ family response regulator
MGSQAVRMCREHTPDITLMDLRMPVMSGVEAIRAIHKDFPGARFIVLTTYHGDEDIHRALKAGARAYLPKGLSDTDITASGSGHSTLVGGQRASHKPINGLTTRTVP